MVEIIWTCYFKFLSSGIEDKFWQTKSNCKPITKSEKRFNQLQQLSKLCGQYIWWDRIEQKIWSAKLPIHSYQLSANTAVCLSTLTVFALSLPYSKNVERPKVLFYKTANLKWQKSIYSYFFKLLKAAAWLCGKVLACRINSLSSTTTVWYWHNILVGL